MGRSRSNRRLNLKALAGTAIVALVLVGGGLVAAGVLRDRVRDQLLTQSGELVERGQATLAMRHLEQFLGRNPDDVEVLDRYTRLLSEAVLKGGDVNRLDPAISHNERLLRVDPEGVRAEDPQRNRRWLAELSIIKSDLIRREYGVYDLDEAGEAIARDSRDRAAAQIARELIDRGAEDAEAYRLLAMAQEGIAGRTRPVDDAVRSYDRALALDPADAVSAERLARLHRDRRGDPAAADRVLDDLTRAAPDDPAAWLAVYRHRDADEADPDRASAALARALELAPENPDVVTDAAGDALRRGDREAAVALLDRLPERTRALPRVALMRASIDFQGRRSDEAIARLREALGDAQGGDAELVRTLAIALIEAGDLAGARPLVERYRGLAGPGREPIYRFLVGMFQQKSGQPDEAIKSFNAAERGLNDPMKAQMLAARGRCKLVLGDRFGAIQDYRAAVNLAPDSPLPRLALVEALAAEGVERALTELRQGIAAAPDSIELRHAQLRLLLAVQAGAPSNRRSWSEFDAALREARSRPKIGDDPALVALEVQRQLLDGRTEEALARLEAAVERRPDAATLWTTWADALLRDGRREEALAVLERASAPEAAGDSAAFRVGRAQVLSQLGRGREAIEALAEGAERLPSDQRVPVLQALGRMQAARGQLAEARASFTAWKRLQPGSAAPPLALMGLAIDTGDRSAAEAALRELRGDPSREPDLPYRLGFAEYLIRTPGADPAARAREALEQLRPILEDGPDGRKAAAPDLPSALLLRGLARAQLGDHLAEPEATGRRSEALSDLKKAWEAGERKAAGPMIDLMVRLDRFDELDRLPRLGAAGIDAEIDRMAAESCLRHGRDDRAADYLERASQAAPDTPQFASWRMAMLDRLGRTPQVEQALRAQAENRRDAASWIALIRYQAARGQRDGAEASIAEMKRAVEADPPELLEAQAREAIGDLGAADDAFKAALERRPDSPAALLAASRFDRAVGRIGRALERADRALAADPGSRPAARFKALLMAEVAADDESWRAAWEALGAEPPAGAAEAPEDRLARAIVLSRHPDPSRREEAVGRLEALVDDQPSGDLFAVAARESLARLLLQQGRADRAAEVAAVTAIAGTNPAAVALYAQALIAAGQLDEAARQFDRLRNLAPGSEALGELELLLVEARAEAGSFAEELEASYHEAIAGPEAEAEAEASSTFRRLVQLGEPAAEVAERVGRDLAGRFPELSWMPSQWFATRGAHDEALDLAEQALAADEPAVAFQAARSVLTVVERSNADPSYMDRSGALIERAAAVGDLSATRAVLAMFRHFQGRSDPSRYDDEIRLYRDLVREEPENAIYLNNLAWGLSECSGRPDEALELIDRALETLGTRVPELLDTRGVILDRLGRRDEAIETLEEVVRNRPNKGLYQFHLARALAAAGRDDRAREAIARALELGLTADELEPFEREPFERLRGL